MSVYINRNNPKRLINNELPVSRAITTDCSCLAGAVPDTFLKNDRFSDRFSNEKVIDLDSLMILPTHCN